MMPLIRTAIMSSARYNMCVLENRTCPAFYLNSCFAFRIMFYDVSLHFLSVPSIFEGTSNFIVYQ